MKNNQAEYLTQARSLRADILAAPAVWLPRREILLEWLGAFLVRAAAPKYELQDDDAADLRALDRFLRQLDIPVAG